MNHTHNFVPLEVRTYNFGGAPSERVLVIACSCGVVREVEVKRE